jgi:hypothetical protein
MKKLIILDYSTGIAHLYLYSEEVWPDGSNLDKLIEAFGHNLENCEYMSTDKDLIIH